MRLTQPDPKALRPPFLVFAVVARTPASDVAGAARRLTSLLDGPTSTTPARGGDHALVMVSGVPGHASDVHDIADDVATELDVLVLHQWAPTLRHARLSYEAIEASLASIAARHDGRGRRCVRFSDAILDQWLAGLPLSDRVTLVRRLLGGVLTLSRPTADLLLETVEVLIEESGHQSRAAARLGRHRRSIGHRKRRFAQVTGLDTNNIQHRLLILVGLRLLRVSGGTLPPVGDPQWSNE